MAISSGNIRNPRKFDRRRALTVTIVAEASHDSVAIERHRVVRADRNIDHATHTLRNIALAAEIDAETAHGTIVKNRSVVKGSRVDTRDASAVEI
jgi:hypothetical protein